MTIAWHRGWPYLVRWNNVPYHPKRTAFLLNGKCGNSSVKAALLEAQQLDASRPHRATEVWSPARVARSGYAAIGVVRNPYARAVSVWHQKLVKGGTSGLMRKADFRRGMDFVDFLRVVERMDDRLDTHIRSQWYTMMHRGRFLPDFWIRLEDQNGWDRVRERLPELPDLPRRNMSKAPDWEGLVQGEAGEIIRRRWRKDFEIFGYEM